MRDSYSDEHNYRWYVGGGGRTAAPLRQLVVTDGPKLEIYPKTCQVLQWSRNPPFNNVDWTSDFISSLPSFALRANEIGVLNPIADSSYLWQYAFLNSNPMTSSPTNLGALTSSDAANVEWSTPYPKIKAVFVYYNEFTAHRAGFADFNACDALNVVIPAATASLTNFIPNTGDTCCTVVKYILPDNTTVRRMNIRWGGSSTCKIFGLRFQPFPNPSTPFKYDFINTAGNASKDPKFFSLYEFSDVTADLQPSSYTGPKSYQPWCNRAKYVAGQFKYMPNKDNFGSGAIWGGLGYANEAAALAAGWEKIYNLYDFWINGTLTQVTDQQGPGKAYWYRKPV